MIVRKQCCNGRRVNGFRSFGAAINDFDSFIKAVVGASTDVNRQMLVISEWLCGRGYWHAALNMGEWYTPMVQVLNDMEASSTRDAFMTAAGIMVTNKSIHKDASCAGSGATTGSSTGMSVEDMIKTGEKATKDIIDLFDGDNKTPPTTTPPTTTPPGKTPPDTKKPTSWMTFVALGAAGLAAAMLLPKKK